MSVSAIFLFCTVVGVADGDTLTARCDIEQIKIRLAEIDAPEKRQPFGMKSKQSLSELCFQRKAEIRQVDRDRYGRVVARVRCDDVDANAEQIRRGMAWVYDKYAKDASLYKLQDEARVMRTGLWADPDPIPPWNWRKSNKPRSNKYVNQEAANHG